MEHIDGDRVWRYLFGDRHLRWALIVSVVGLLSLASVAFLFGLNARLVQFSWWFKIAPGIAVVAGVFGAGLLPTVGSLWLVGLWGYAFPPLVGYLSGNWTPASRYTVPRMQAFAYRSARAELLGGLEKGVDLAVILAVIVGTVGYIVGSVIRRAGAHARSS